MCFELPRYLQITSQPTEIPLPLLPYNIWLEADYFSTFSKAPSVPVKLQQLAQSKVVNKRIIGVKILITTKFNKPKKQSLYICSCRMFEIIFFIIVHI